MNFMQKFINDQMSSTFSDLTKRSGRECPKNISQSSFYLKRYYLNTIRGPKLRNDVIDKEEKDAKFKLKMKLIIFDKTLNIKINNFSFSLQIPPQS